MYMYYETAEMIFTTVCVIIELELELESLGETRGDIAIDKNTR